MQIYVVVLQEYSKTNQEATRDLAVEVAASNMRDAGMAALFHVSNYPGASLFRVIGVVNPQARFEIGGSEPTPA